MDFIRVHQSHLINASHVQRYIKGSGGYVQMSDDSIIEVSRRKKELLMERFLK
jgi:two-component system LytT family response regulator